MLVPSETAAKVSDELFAMIVSEAQQRIGSEFASNVPNTCLSGTKVDLNVFDDTLPRSV